MSLSHVHGRSPRGITTTMPVISPGLDIATKMTTSPMGFGSAGRKSPVLGMGAARRRADQQPSAGKCHLERENVGRLAMLGPDTVAPSSPAASTISPYPERVKDWRRHDRDEEGGGPEVVRESPRCSQAEEGNPAVGSARDRDADDTGAGEDDAEISDECEVVTPSSEGAGPPSQQSSDGVVVAGAGQLAAGRKSLDHVGATIWTTTARRVSEDSYDSFPIGILGGFSSPSIGSSGAPSDDDGDDRQVEDDEENPENGSRFGVFRRGKTPGDLLGVGGDVSPWGEVDYQLTNLVARGPAVAAPAKGKTSGGRKAGLAAGNIGGGSKRKEGMAVKGDDDTAGKGNPASGGASPLPGGKKDSNRPLHDVGQRKGRGNSRFRLGAVKGTEGKDEEGVGVAQKGATENVDAMVHSPSLTLKAAAKRKKVSPRKAEGATVPMNSLEYVTDRCEAGSCSYVDEAAARGSDSRHDHHGEWSAKTGKGAAKHATDGSKAATPGGWISGRQGDHQSGVGSKREGGRYDSSKVKATSASIGAHNMHELSGRVGSHVGLVNVDGGGVGSGVYHGGSPARGRIGRDHSSSPAKGRVSRGVVLAGSGAFDSDDGESSGGQRIKKLSVQGRGRSEEGIGSKGVGGKGGEGMGGEGGIVLRNILEQQENQRRGSLGRDSSAGTPWRRAESTSTNMSITAASALFECSISPSRIDSNGASQWPDHRQSDGVAPDHATCGNRTKNGAANDLIGIQRRRKGVAKGMRDAAVSGTAFSGIPASGGDLSEDTDNWVVPQQHRIMIMKHAPSKVDAPHGGTEDDVVLSVVPIKRDLERHGDVGERGEIPTPRSALEFVRGIEAEGGGGVRVAAMEYCKQCLRRYPKSEVSHAAMDKEVFSRHLSKLQDAVCIALSCHYDKIAHALSLQMAAYTRMVLAEIEALVRQRFDGEFLELEVRMEEESAQLDIVWEQKEEDMQVTAEAEKARIAHDFRERSAQAVFERMIVSNPFKPSRDLVRARRAVDTMTRVGDAAAAEVSRREAAKLEEDERDLWDAKVRLMSVEETERLKARLATRMSKHSVDREAIKRVFDVHRAGAMAAFGGRIQQMRQSLQAKCDTQVRYELNRVTSWLQSLKASASGLVTLMGPVGGTARSERNLKQGQVLSSKVVVSERTLPGHKSKTMSKSSVKSQVTMAGNGRQLVEDRGAVREHHATSVTRYPGMRIFQEEAPVHAKSINTQP